MILIKVRQATRSHVTKRSVHVVKKENVNSIKDIWRAQAIQASWLKIKFTLEITIMSHMTTSCLHLGALPRRRTCSITKKQTAFLEWQWENT